MSDLLQDELNLQIMKLICSGIGVDVNINYLAKKFGKHRNTIYQKIAKLYDHKIIEKPVFSFHELLKELPLIILEKSDLPRTPEINNWIEIDPHIWAAFFVKNEEFNTFLIQLHNDIYSYQDWKEAFNDNYLSKVPSQKSHYPSEVIYLSSKSIIKYNPQTSVSLLENYLNKQNHIEISNLKIDPLTFDILKALTNGEGINTNYNELSKHLNAHRKTIQRRIEILLQNNILLPPVCFFPRKWTPPEYIFAISLIEVRKYKNRVLKSLINDSHLPLIIKAQYNHYNLVVFSNFYNIEEHLNWMEEIDQRFPDSIGAIKTLYLSPKMTFSISLYYVAITYLEKLLNELHGKKFKEIMT